MKKIPCQVRMPEDLHNEILTYQKLYKKVHGKYLSIERIILRRLTESRQEFLKQIQELSILVAYKEKAI